MTITKGSRAAHERSLKAAETRRRNKEKKREMNTASLLATPRQKKSKTHKAGTPKQRQLALEIHRLYRRYDEISSFAKDRQLQDRKRRLREQIREKELQLHRLNKDFARTITNKQFSHSMNAPLETRYK